METVYPQHSRSIFLNEVLSDHLNDCGNCKCYVKYRVTMTLNEVERQQSETIPLE